VGIDRFTVDQVIERAKIAKGTVYNYYKNKDEMLAELGSKALSLMLSHFHQGIQEYTHGVDRVKSICISSYEFYRLYPQYFELISYMERPDFDIDMSAYLKISQNITEMVKGIVAEGQQKKEIKNNISSEMITYIIWACSVGVIQFVDTKKNMLTNVHEISTREMVIAFSEMITEGIKV